MTDIFADHAGPTDRYDRAAAILKAYPDIDETQLRELKQWFDAASAFDIASLASNDAIAEQYRRFRADHLDRFSAKDVLWVIVGIAILVGVIGAIGYLAP